MKALTEMSEDQAIAAGYDRTEWQQAEKIRQASDESLTPGLATARAAVRAAEESLAAAHTEQANALQIQLALDKQAGALKSEQSRLAYAQGQLSTWRNVLNEHETKMNHAIIGSDAFGFPTGVQVGMEIAGLRELVSGAEAWIPQQRERIATLEADLNAARAKLGLTESASEGNALEAPADESKPGRKGRR